MSENNFQDVLAVNDLVYKEPEFQINKQTEKIIDKWSKKTENFLSLNDKRNISILLENTYRNVEKEPNSTLILFDNHISSLNNQAEILKNKLNASDDSDFKIFLESEISKKREEIIKYTKSKFNINPCNSFFLRGVNIYDEIVKFYDYLKFKDIVGVQPMFGPVGLAYASRLKTYDDEKIQEMIENCDTPEKLKNISPETLKQILNSNEEIIMDQKEIVARTCKIEVLPNTKFSGKLLAEKIDKMLFDRIYNISTKKKINNNHSLQWLSETIFEKTKIACATFILCSSVCAVRLKNEISNLNLKLIIVDDYLPKENEFILGYKGKTEAYTGIVFNPYIACMFPHSRLEGISIVDQLQEISSVMTRFAICDNLPGTSDFYLTCTYE